MLHTVSSAGPAKTHQEWRHTLMFSILRESRQKDSYEIKASPCYEVRPYLDILEKKKFKKFKNKARHGDVYL